jgi:predicted nuclease with RNAse H fold
MPETILGIDFAGPNRTSGYALLDTSGALLDVGLIGDDAAILDLIDRTVPSTVAIDCPLGLPAGLDCLDPACGCAPTSPRGIANANLPCARSVRPLLHHQKDDHPRHGRTRHRPPARPEARGVRVIEVYPYATKRISSARRNAEEDHTRRRSLARDRLTTVVPDLRTSRVR